MKKGENRQKRGFTIIEVVLVLAIAGLIFLMMFIALPALNRAQRDSRRRDDISIFLKKVKDYQTNNRGTLPPDLNEWNKMVSDYIGDFEDPNGESYVLLVRNCNQSNLGTECQGALNDTTTFPNGHTLTIFKAATCDGERALQSSNPRKIAVQYKLEGGGIYCANT